MIEIIHKPVDMPPLDEQRYQYGRVSRRGCEVIDTMNNNAVVFKRDYETAAIAKHNLNKKFYKESAMRKSTFKKTFQSQGLYGSHTANVVATLNYTYKSVTGSTYIPDFFSNSVPLHKVEIFIDDALWKTDKEIRDEDKVLICSKNFITEAKAEIEKRCTTAPVVSFIDQMKELFSDGDDISTIYRNATAWMPEAHKQTLKDTEEFNKGDGK